MQQDLERLFGRDTAPVDDTPPAVELRLGRFRMSLDAVERAVAQPGDYDVRDAELSHSMRCMA